MPEGGVNTEGTVVGEATVAIVTRTKNRPLTLRRALDSVARQTFTDYVHVIVNDGGDPVPVDAVVAACEPEARARVRVVHHPVSVGMEAASNAGIRATASEYLLIHDDDDSLHPEFLAITVGFLERERATYAAVTSWVTVVKETMSADGITTISESLYRDLTSVRIGRMVVGNELVPISVLYRRDVHAQVGLYDESLPVLGDWEFYLRLLEQYDVGVVPRQLARYHQRVSPDQDYANSLSGAAEKHARYDTLVRNRMFRRDARSGVAGVGVLAQLAGLGGGEVSASAESYVRGVVDAAALNMAEQVAIYGTGSIGTQIFHAFKRAGLGVAAFVENDDVRTESYLGVPVLTLTTALEAGLHDIAVGSWEHRDAVVGKIQAGCRAHGVRPRIFVG